MWQSGDGPFRLPSSPYADDVRPDGDAPPQPPTLILNPRGDEEFEAFALQLVRDGLWLPRQLEAGLRPRYPLARVHMRELSGEPRVVLYVYRDGHWLPD